MATLALPGFGYGIRYEYGMFAQRIVDDLGCRAARYIPAVAGAACSPVNVPQTAFPVEPGGAMPPVAGCAQQDYAVLIVIGVALKA